MAHYALGDRVGLAVDPKTAGDVSGAGVFENGTATTTSGGQKSVTVNTSGGSIFFRLTHP